VDPAGDVVPQRAGPADLARRGRVAETVKQGGKRGKPGIVIAVRPRHVARPAADRTRNGAARRLGEEQRNPDGVGGDRGDVGLSAR